MTDLETRVDAAVEGNLDPGSRPFQRLNRAEYQRAVRDLLDLNVDVTPFLPADSISNGFDNVADAQSFSPTLMEGYLRAASRITALAAGDATAPASESNYKPPKTASQLRRVEGAPVGTRGGISVMHTFPADGDYIFRMDLMSNACGVLFGGTADGEQLEVSIDGERVALIEINPKMIESTTGVTLKTEPIHLTAGSKRVTAAFVQQFEGPVIDLIAPIEHTLADTQIGVGLRHHDAAASQGHEHRRAVSRERCVRYGEPPEALLAAARRRPAKRRRARRASSSGWRPTRSAGRCRIAISRR